jgi:hypothetical protein
MVSSTYREAPHYVDSPFPYYLFLLRLKYFPPHSIWTTLSPCFSLYARGKISRPYQTTHYRYSIIPTSYLITNTTCVSVLNFRG